MRPVMSFYQRLLSISAFIFRKVLLQYSMIASSRRILSFGAFNLSMFAIEADTVFWIAFVLAFAF